MESLYKKLLDDLDNLMIALKKQKKLSLDADLMQSIIELTKSRNAFKRKFIQEYIKIPAAKNQSVFTHFLDNISDEVAK